MGALLAAARRPPKPKTSPLVSVVIPTYNWSSVLRYAIASVLRQTYSNFEVLVIGDCCTDDSAEVVASFSDTRVHWQNLPANSGSQSAPNNRGIESARGEIVAYLGHDDIWLPSHLARIVHGLESTPAAGAYTISLALGPPGTRLRVLGGVGEWHERPWILPTAFAHRRDAVDQTGLWRDYRTVVDTPDQEFIARVAGARGGIVPVHALTACKFSSAWRRDSYIHRRSDEQAEYFARTRKETAFIARELSAYAWTRLVHPQVGMPAAHLDPAPEVIPPGWRVTQARKLRGLPEHPDG